MQASPVKMLTMLLRKGKCLVVEKAAKEHHTEHRKLHLRLGETVERIFILAA